MSRRLDAFDIPDKTKTYVRMVLNPFLEELVHILIKDQPVNPSQFIYEYLQKTLHVVDELKQEIQNLEVCNSKMRVKGTCFSR